MQVVRRKRKRRGWATIAQPKAKSLSLTPQIKEERRLNGYTSAVAREKDRITHLCKQVIRTETEVCDIKIGVIESSSGKRIWLGANKQRLMDHCQYFYDLWITDDSTDTTKLSECMSDGSLDADEGTGSGDSDSYICDDISEEAMRMIIAISFDQFDSQRITPEQFADYLYASQQYGVHILKDCCEEMFENVHRYSFDACLFICADLFKLGMMDKYEALSQRIKVYESSVGLTRAFNSPNFMSFPIEMIMHIISSEKLCLEEYQIFRRCHIWCGYEANKIMRIREEMRKKDDTHHWTAEEKCAGSDAASFSVAAKKKEDKTSIMLELLNKLKPFIRFPLMNPKQIAHLNSLEGMFTAQELLNYYLYKFGETKPDKPSMVEKRKLIIETGQKFDVRDHDGCWHTGTVLNTRKNGILVKFDDIYTESFGEWFAIKPDCICTCLERGQCRFSPHIIDVLHSQTKWNSGMKKFQDVHPPLMGYVASMAKEQKRMLEVWKAVTSMKSNLCDVKISVRKQEDNEERVWIGANKSRLKEQSAFFQAVWHDDHHDNTHGSVEEKCESLHLDGITEQAMRAVVAISFGQYDSVIINKNTVVDCLYAGLTYGIQLLYECCNDTIQEWANSESTLYFKCFSLISKLNSLGMTDYAHKLTDKLKFYNCTKKIVSILRSDTALELPFDIFSKIIQQDSLDVPEFEIWERCIAWAQYQYDEDEAGYQGMVIEELQKLKPFIRFTRMTHEQLASLYKWSAVVSSKELSLLFSVRFDRKLSADLFCNTKPRKTMI